MPVEDHPVHDKVIKRSKHPGCYNKSEFMPSYNVAVKEVNPRGYTGNWLMEIIPHRMTSDCQAAKERYTECEGCRWINNE